MSTRTGAETRGERLPVAEERAACEVRVREPAVACHAPRALGALTAGWGRWQCRPKGNAQRRAWAVVKVNGTYLLRPEESLDRLCIPGRMSLRLLNRGLSLRGAHRSQPQVQKIDC